MNALTTRRDLERLLAEMDEAADTECDGDHISAGYWADRLRAILGLPKPEGVWWRPPSTRVGSKS